jgi:polysaccharide deacetylase family protein (PEP-CTERM system associated)
MFNAFSIDVEDGVSIAMRDRFGVAMRQTDRVLKNTRKILDMLEENDTRATFFILGQVAEVFPNLVREISEGGHEIGVHGFDHRLFSQMDPTQAFEEVRRAKVILEDIIGAPVVGHRAPCFSIDPSTAWALDVLLEAGFEYDSSIMPCSGVGYGWPGHSLDIGPIRTPSGASIMEVPLTVTSVLGKNVPALGGSYFRLLPYAVCRRIFQKVQRVRPAIVYLHPYELDTEKYPDSYFEELNASPILTQARMRSFWLRRRSLATRYSRLLGEHKFVPIRDLLLQI